MAWLTGMWQFALFALLSLLSGLITSSLIKRNRREPDFDYSDQPIWLSNNAVAIGDRVLPRSGFLFKEKFSDFIFDYLSKLEKDKEVQAKAM